MAKEKVDNLEVLLMNGWSDTADISSHQSTDSEDNQWILRDLPNVEIWRLREKENSARCIHCCELQHALLSYAILLN